MDCRVVLCFTFFLLLLMDSGFSIRWLSLQHSHLRWNLTSVTVSQSSGRGIRSRVRSPCGEARRKYGFAKLQAKLCRSSMEAMPHVQRAAVLAAQTCREVFQDRRWNCSSIITAPYLSPDLTRATREQAYVYAISSAALTYTMARACASGGLYHCSCAPKPTEPLGSIAGGGASVVVGGLNGGVAGGGGTGEAGSFQWGGCGDNIQWGMYFSRRFIDNVEKSNANRTGRGGKRRRDDQMVSDEERRKLELKRSMAEVNLHNNKIGRKVIMQSLQTQCKCHGVSGSCSIKTCWKSLPPMVEIGRKLLRSYTNAVELSRRQDNVPTTGRRRRSGDTLWYISRSPDYCTKDEKLGSLGTIGRKCNVTSHGPDSCRQMCCGRGYRTLVEERVERCQCKYYNCCYVKCNICRTTTQVFECS